MIVTAGEPDRGGRSLVGAADRPPPPLDHLLFQGSLATIGAFRAPPDHPHFSDSGPIQNWVFVFPRTSVWIRHEGEEGFVCDPTSVSFYNRGQVYRRGRITEDGDRCEWFAVPPEVILEAMRPFEPTAEEHPERPFSFSRGPSAAATYARQRRLVQRLLARDGIDPLEVEETVLGLLDDVLASAYRGLRADPRHSPATGRSHRELVENARALMASIYRETTQLREIAAALSVAPGHLSRVFRRLTGTTLHEYRAQLRLRAALEGLILPESDLTQLAFDFGYSSHSHFTERFRRIFGITPSEFRTALRAHPGRARTA